MSKEKEKLRQKRQAKYEKERAQVLEFRRLAPALKASLKKVGCDLRFYEYLDSFEDEFSRTVAAAREELPSLCAVHEVDMQDFESTDWSKFGCDASLQIFFDIDDRFENYGKSNPKANLRGSATYFQDGTTGFTSLVLVPRNPMCSVEYKDLKYATKMAVLLHELGHVRDAELRINIDPIAKRFDLVEAEVYANCACLDGLAERCMATTYADVYEAMVTLAVTDGFMGEIGRLVLERHPRHDITKWLDYSDAAKSIAGTGKAFRPNY